MSSKKTSEKISENIKDNCHSDSSNNSNEIKNKNKKNYFLTTIKNTSFFVIISLITKILNLVINIFVIRKISKKTFGTAKIYFETSFLMLQYFPLETMRKTTQKYCCYSDHEDVENIRFEQCSRVTWMLNIIFIFISIPYWYIYVTYGENLSEVKFQMFLHLFCANIELYVEPILLYCNVKFFNNYRLILVTLSNYVKVFSTFILVIFVDMELWGFTLARIFSSVIYVIYALYVGYKELNLKTSSIFPFSSIFKNCVSLKEENIKNQKIFKDGQINKFSFFNLFSLYNPLLKEIFLSFVYINILKMILTYTEKIFLGFFIHFHESEKSEYSFVTDNFAILIRFLLEPLESNFFNLINKIKVPVDDGKMDKNEEEEDPNKKNLDESETEILNKKISDNIAIKKQETVRKLLNILNMFLRFLLIFGCLLVGYIYTIGKEVFMLVFGSEWVTTTSIIILKNYSIYIFIISINGIVEAFGNAISNSRQMRLFNKMMIFNSIILISCSFFMNGYSVLGLVYANGLAMIFRIFGNLYIIFSQSEKNEFIEKEGVSKIKKQKENDEDIDILNNVNSDVSLCKKSNEQHIKIFKVAILFKDCLFRLESLVIIILSVFFVYKISFFNVFEDNNYRKFSIINNNFLKVLFSGLIFLINVFFIYLFERKDFKTIYNNSV